jgi:hypothetical protein
MDTRPSHPVKEQAMSTSLRTLDQQLVARASRHWTIRLAALLRRASRSEAAPDNLDARLKCDCGIPDAPRPAVVVEPGLMAKLMSLR